jgi:hypothetical protein
MLLRPVLMKDLRRQYQAWEPLPAYELKPFFMDAIFSSGSKYSKEHLDAGLNLQRHMNFRFSEDGNGVMIQAFYDVHHVARRYLSRRMDFDILSPIKHGWFIASAIEIQDFFGIQDERIRFEYYLCSICNAINPMPVNCIFCNKSFLEKAREKKQLKLHLSEAMERRRSCDQL